MPARLRRRLVRIAAVRAGARALVLWRERAAARRRPREALRYLAHGRELSNFTYEVANLDEAAELLAGLLRAAPEEIHRYMRELEEDETLRAGLAARLQARPDREPRPRYGKRALYYCVVRHERPGLVVETGTHDGLASMVLGRALARNAAEGAPGELLTFDVNAEAGWLIDEAITGRIRRHVGDARDTLPPALAGRTVDVFLHDSLKTLEQERFEFKLALRHRGRRIVLITDEARATGVLHALSAREGGRYASFTERPLGHWWPGNEIGLVVIEDRM